MEARYCENHIAELSRFFKWLHKSKGFDWRKPQDFDDLETKVKDLPEERTGIGFLNVEVFRIEELAVLYKYATPLERLLILLGLNCGFKGAEQGTLRFEHLFLDRPHLHAVTMQERTGFDLRPDERFVLYSRNKSKVYGEFLLWPQTIEGLVGPWPGTDGSASGRASSPRSCSSRIRVSRSTAARPAGRT